MGWKTHEEAMEFWNSPNFVGATEPAKVICEKCKKEFYANCESYDVPKSREWFSIDCPWCNPPSIAIGEKKSGIIETKSTIKLTVVYEKEINNIHYDASFLFNEQDKQDPRLVGMMILTCIDALMKEYDKRFNVAYGRQG